MKRFCILWLAFAGCSNPTAMDRLREDEATAEEAIRQYVARGESSLPELRAALDDPDPRVRRRAKTAIGRITGQWGTSDGIRWKRSLAEATDRGRPVLVLQLFGKFDEEFC